MEKRFSMQLAFLKNDNKPKNFRCIPEEQQVSKASTNHAFCLLFIPTLLFFVSIVLSSHGHDLYLIIFLIPPYASRILS